MKKIIYVILFYCLLFTATTSNSQWLVQQFNANGNGVCFIPGTATGYMACSGGYIRKSTDNGASWINLSTGTTVELNSVSFVNVNKGWAVGNSGTILKTTNGGINWLAQSVGSADPLWDLDVSMGDTVLITGIAGKVHRTTNGGINWSTTILGGGTASIYSVYFYNYLDAYACDGAGRVYVTFDAGATWIQRTTPAISALYAITKISSTLIACGFGGNIIKSTNQGINWVTINSGVTSYLNAVSWVSPSVFLIATSSGLILRSTDAGDNFIQLSSSGSPLEDIAVGDNNNLSACGLDGITKHSTDAGLTWSVNPGGDNGNISSINFISPLNGYAVNSNGYFFKTTNGGNSWEGYSAASFNFTDVFFVNPSTGFVSTQQTLLSSPATSSVSSSIIRTTNGGINWSVNSISNISKIASLDFVDASNGFALGSATVGTSTIVLKTTNSGDSWLAVSLFNEDVRSLCFINASTGWAAGWNGFLQKTTNGGVNWQVQNSQVTTVLYSVYFVNQSQGYACGGNGTIIATTNGGANWNSLNSGVSGFLYSVHFGSPLYGFCVGELGTRLRTTNGGITWQNQPEAAGMDLAKCFMTSPTSAFVCGPLGYISNYSGTITSVNQQNNNVPSEFSLSQNYPNPFNPSTKINFSIPVTPLSFREGLGLQPRRGVRLIVYDILGRESAVLVNENLSPGNYSINFNASELSCGVYFYRITSGEFTDTKKMILIK